MKSVLTVTLASFILLSGCRENYEETSKALFSEAFQIANATQNDVIRRNSFYYLAKAQATSGDVSSALESLTRAVEKDGNLIYNPYLYTMAISALAIEQSTANDIPNAFNNISKAQNSLSRIEDNRQRIEAITSIAIAQSLVGDKLGAEASVGDALDIPLNEMDADTQSECLLIIATAQGAIGDNTGMEASASEALKNFEDVNSDYIKVKILSLLANAKLTVGDGIGARDDISKAINIMDEFYPKTDYFIVDSYIKIATAQIKALDKSGAEETLLKARDVNLPALQDMKVEILSNMAALFKELGG
jgi:hypothetical protein